MKKSWHPLLLKNQERVWLEEKKALEEKKKLDQLRKEKEEERQLQELQRLQEEQTGKKRTEKLEWMYTTPATGSNQNANDLEDYLLGKKRVDKILTADDNIKLGASHKSFIAVQNANTARDIASKIREDPFFAMKQQEQAAYQALMSNPLRLRELQERNGIKPKKSREERKQEKRGRYAGDSRKRQRSLSPVSDGARRSRTPPPHSRSRRADSASKYINDTGDRAARGEGRGSRYAGDSRKRQRSPSPVNDDPKRSWITPPSHSRSRPADSASKLTNDTGDRATRGEGRGGRYAGDSRKRQRSPSPVNDGAKRSRMTPPPHTRSHPADSVSKPTNDAGDRAARLAAMQSNASGMEFDRQKRLLELLAKEKAELEAENEVRSKSRGMGGFLSQEQKKVFGGEGGLEDRIRRGRGGLVVDAD